ncbi:hypothetical protein GIB67_005964 [Kingdonia uniflora]|uniref:Trafficking protein particle complex subunit 2 n=1 Tax=Kingdonia uniflora TaxID=39325 RepID=A0A7J7MBZ9_9MAGN|nr:hypothetical protein GIB67_005964 [Kingdonia uniflora]
MASTACFIIVSRNDIPIYEAEVGSAVKKEEAAHQHQFILHAALDIVQDLAWTTSAMFLKSVDRFNDLVVSVYVTAGHILFMLQIKIAYSLLICISSAVNTSLVGKGSWEFLPGIRDWTCIIIFINITLASILSELFLFSLTAHFIHTRLMLLHDSRNDDGIKSFFQEVHELYIKILLNPLYLPGSRVTSSHFDTKVRALARKYL